MFQSCVKGVNENASVCEVSVCKREHVHVTLSGSKPKYVTKGKVSYCQIDHERVAWIVIFAELPAKRAPVILIIVC